MRDRFLPFALLACVGACAGDGGGGPADNPIAPSGIGSGTGSGSATGPQTTTAPLPTGLTMPMRVDDINLRGVINLFGIVRSSLDLVSVGHPGHDIPLNTGAPLFAVADGTIVTVGPSIDSRPGSIVKILIAADQTPGRGWVFLYEHVTLLGGLGVDSLVTRGQQIATNPLDPAFGNHLELAHTFNNYEFHEDQTCWVDQLDGSARAEFVNRFNTILRTDPRFIAAWQSVTFNEGRLPFRELLNTMKYPDGARLCYPPGTDERVDP